MRNFRKSMAAIGAAAFSTMSLFSFSSQAATFTWNGATVNWNLATNWQTGAPATDGTADLLFTSTGVTGTSGSPLLQNISASYNAKSITFSPTALSFFIGGSP